MIILIAITTTACSKEKDIDGVNYIRQLNLEEPKSYTLVVDEYDTSSNYIHTLTLTVDCANTYCDYYINKSSDDQTIINQHYVYDYDENTYYSYLEATLNGDHRKIKRKISSLPSTISSYSYKTVSNGLESFLNNHDSDAYTIKKQSQEDDKTYISFDYSNNNTISSFDYTFQNNQIICFKYNKITYDDNHNILTQKQFTSSLKQGDNITKYNISDYVLA